MIPALVHGGVQFIVIGGFAGIVHGSARVTYDVDLVYSRADENIKRLAEALALHAPYLPKDLEAIAELRVLLEERK